MSSDDPAERAAVARKVATRRLKRRLKAAASIGLAIMAGAFLACTPEKTNKEKVRAPVPPNPMTPSVGALPSPASLAPDAGAGAGGEAGRAGSLATAAGGNASSTAIVPAAKTPHKAPTVDRQEHRKGMPVPDNLLE